MRSTTSKPIVDVASLRRRVNQLSSISRAIEAAEGAELATSLARFSDCSGELNHDLAELKIAADRKLGALLARMPVTPDGIPVSQTKRLQQLSLIPDAVFREYCRDQRGRKKEITSLGLIRKSKASNRLAGELNGRPGLPCKFCGSRVNICDHNEGTPGKATRRSRRCLNCNRTWRTVETVLE